MSVAGLVPPLLVEKILVVHPASVLQCEKKAVRADRFGWTTNISKSKLQRYRPNLGAVELLALLANADTDGNFEVGVVLLDVVRKLTGLLIRYFFLMEGREDLRLAEARSGLTVGKPHAKWLREKMFVVF